MIINHPLKEGDQVLAKIKTCACTGGQPQEVRGKILKVIHNQSGYWYYLSTRHTIKHDNVIKVL
jgi:hypothetical protein